MSPATRKLHLKFIPTEPADVFIAYEEDGPVDYYYGGTRFVNFSTKIDDLKVLLLRLLREESAFKNRLIDLAFQAGALDRITEQLPANFSVSRVGGARCILRPRSHAYQEILQNREDPLFDSAIALVFHEIGAFLNALDGRIKLTPDFGKFAFLADRLKSYTQHVLGISASGGCGGKSIYSAEGIIAAIKCLKIENDHKKPVTLIGSDGALGSHILRFCAAAGFSDLAVCDLRYEQRHHKPPPGCQLLLSDSGTFTPECLRRGGFIIVTINTEALEFSDLRILPRGTVLVLAQNLSVPWGDTGQMIAQNLMKQDVLLVPGQVLTLGGTLASRLEWFSRQINPHFDKPLALEVIRTVVSFLMNEIYEKAKVSSVSIYEAMLAFTARKLE